jgi:hypothetical protein
MEPRVHDSHLDQVVDPFLTKQIIEVRLTQTRANPRHDFVVQAVLQTLHRFAVHIRFATALVADDLTAFDANQRGDIATLSKSFGDFVCDEMPIGKDLEIDVFVSFKDFEQFFVHKGLTAQKTEKTIAHLLGSCDHSVECIDLDLVLLMSHIDPTALTTQIATVNDRNVKIGRKELASLQAAFVLANTTNAFDTHIPKQLPKKPFVGFQQHSFRHAKVHIISELNRLPDRDGLPPLIEIPLYRKPPTTHVLCFTIARFL